jgi:hypothetical protein
MEPRIAHFTFGRGRERDLMTAKASSHTAAMPDAAYSECRSAGAKWELPLPW